MSKKKISGQKLVDLTRELFHECYKGNLDIWFSHLDKDTIYLGSGNPILFGANAIQTHFNSMKGFLHVEIIDEEYYSNIISSTVYCINGKITLKGKSSLYSATTFFTVIYKIVDDKPIIVQQHNSYEYKSLVNDTSPLEINNGTLAFIQEILLHQPISSKIEIKNSLQNVYIDPCTVFYIQATDKNAEYICMDRIVTSNQSLKNIVDTLPDYFYQIHRSFIINTKYILAIRRFEVELLSGVILPIPEKNYTKIKTDLKKIMIKN